MICKCETWLIDSVLHEVNTQLLT